MIYYLIYTSQATRLMSEDDLTFLLEQSRHNNTTYGLTGMLLYMENKLLNKAEGRFMQMLEGKAQDVELIYQRIVNDPRNRTPLLLTTGEAEQRRFSGWAMGFRFINHTAKLPGFLDLNANTFLNPPFADQSWPLSFLSSFYQINL